MKLYLSSIAVPDRQVLIDLVGKSPSETTVLVITNGFDNCPEDRKEAFITGVYTALRGIGFKLRPLDLTDYLIQPDLLEVELAKADLLWISGGNTFYLRELMHKTGFEKIIQQVLEAGLVYGGESAGAVVAGTTLHGIELLDDPSEAKTIIYDGLNIVPFPLLPHWNSQEDADALGASQKIMRRNSLVEPITLNNNEALVIDGDKRTLVRS